MRVLKAAALVGAILSAGAALAAAGPQGEAKKPGQGEKGPAVERERVIVRPDVRIARAGDSELGVTLRDLDQAAAREHKLATAEGALVQQVRGGSPAEKAGIKAGDVISEFDGERVRSVRQLQRLIGDTPAGRSIRLTVVRDGKKIELSATLARASGEIGGLSEPFDLEGLNRDLRESTRDLPRNFRFYFDDRGLRSPGLREDPQQFEWSVPQPRPPLLGGPAAGRLGAVVQDLTPQLGKFFGAKEGVLVVTVNPDTPAARAGLEAGDVVTSVDGKAVTDAGSLVRMLRDQADGEEVALGVLRDHKPVTLKVRLLSRRPGRPA